MHQKNTNEMSLPIAIIVIAGASLLFLGIGFLIGMRIAADMHKNPDDYFNPNNN
jgi:uncharacterized protein YneF (UPF0154 family)